MNEDKILPLYGKNFSGFLFYVIFLENSPGEHIHSKYPVQL